MTCTHWTKPRPERKPKLLCTEGTSGPAPRRSPRPPQPALRQLRYSHRNAVSGKPARLPHRRRRRRALRQLAQLPPSSPRRPRLPSARQRPQPRSPPQRPRHRRRPVRAPGRTRSMDFDAAELRHQRQHALLLPRASRSPRPQPVAPAQAAAGLKLRPHRPALRGRQPAASPNPLRPQREFTSRLKHQAQTTSTKPKTSSLDDEIAFRQSPVFDESIGTPIEIPANLIEFPRQLVAPRKARPRFAEGPLREDADQAPRRPSSASSRSKPTRSRPHRRRVQLTPEWSSILLAAHPVAAPVETAEAPFLADFRRRPRRSTCA